MKLSVKLNPFYVIVGVMVLFAIMHLVSLFNMNM
jgi:hypothetical protein